MPQIAGVIGAVASVVGTVASIGFSMKAANDRKKQEKLSRQRSARQAVREAQIRRAQSVATAQGAGALFSSGVSGGVGSLTSQLGERLGFSSQYSNLSQDISNANTMADMFSGIASLGGAIYNASGGLSFGGRGTEQPQRQPTYTSGWSSPTPNRPPTVAPYQYNPVTRPYGYY